MKNLFLTLITMLFLVSCGTTNKVVKRTTPTKTVAKSPNLKTLESSYSGSLNSQIKNILKDEELTLDYRKEPLPDEYIQNKGQYL